MDQFFSSELTSLQKEIDTSTAITKTKPEDIDFVYDIPRCIDWIKTHNFQTVCLQFPDFLLPSSTEVAHRLQSGLNQVVYILGDTAYESCCIDFVAAAHINADAIIHFGPVCFSKSDNKIPYLNVYEKEVLDINLLEELIRQNGDLQDVTILLDTPYSAYLGTLAELFKNRPDVRIISIDTEFNLEKVVVYVGYNSRKIVNLQISFKNITLFSYDPRQQSSNLVNCEEDPKILKRRYFLTEKIKDSNTIGIIIGTLAVKNYLKVIERTKNIVKASGKKYYIISVGKPNVAKLANFAEIDIYVMITCAMNEIYESRDFFKPIVTPYDVEVALNPNANELQFSYDYNRYFVDLTQDDIDAIKEKSTENDVSLITGKIRSQSGQPAEPDCDKQVAVRPDGTIAGVSTNFGAGFLAQRSWKGLEQNLGEDEPQVASEGRRGIAQGYTNEQ